MLKRAIRRTVSVSVDGHTKMRATTSLPPPPASWTMGATRPTSSADNQLMMAPSDSRPASFSIPSRSAATMIPGGWAGTRPSLNPLIENVS
jgi:hypothetical protein